MRFKEKQTFAKPTGEINKKKSQNQKNKKKRQRERIIYLVCCNLLGFAIDFNKYSRMYHGKSMKQFNEQKVYEQ